MHRCGRGWTRHGILPEFRLSPERRCTSGFPAGNATRGNSRAYSGASARRAHTHLNGEGRTEAAASLREEECLRLDGL